MEIKNLHKNVKDSEEKGYRVKIFCIFIENGRNAGGKNIIYRKIMVSVAGGRTSKRIV